MGFNRQASNRNTAELLMLIASISGHTICNTNFVYCFSSHEVYRQDV